jgi:hypothetical protein
VPYTEERRRDIEAARYAGWTVRESGRGMWMLHAPDGREVGGFCESEEAAWYGRPGIPDYNRDLTTAWQLFEIARKTMFSDRQLFLHILASEMQVQSYELEEEIKRHIVAWPDALMFLTPKAIVDAFIKWGSIRSMPTYSFEGAMEKVRR